MDDLQRNDVSTLLGDAINAIGSEGNEAKLNLNSGTVIEIPPNFYVIGTYNATETGAIAISGNLMSKFYVREILSDIEYITEDSETENAVYYDQCGVWYLIIWICNIGSVHTIRIGMFLVMGISVEIMFH